MSKAQIVGWAHSPFGKSALENTEQLMASVVALTIDHAGVDVSDIDGIFVGVMNNGFSKQDFQGALVAMGDERLAYTLKQCVSKMPAQQDRPPSIAPWISSKPGAAASHSLSAPKK